MAITQQVYEWDNLSTNSAGTDMGTYTERMANSMPSPMSAGQEYDLFTGTVGRNILVPPTTKATEFVVIENMAASPSVIADFQVVVNTTGYFQPPDLSGGGGVSSLSIPYPCGAASADSTNGVALLQPSFKLNPALYILPGQKWTMKMTPLVDVKGGGGNEGTAIGMMVYYTLYDGPDSLIANKLVEMGIPVSSDNVDWYKMNMISKNLTNLTMTGGVA
jgi:hypothetical protein